MAEMSTEHIPTRLSEALSHPKWKGAMIDEMHALEKNDTWDLTDLPKGKLTVGCKWVSTLKRNPDGSIWRYKARLVAKGFTQASGVDYFETSSPMAKLNSSRVILSLAANLDWPLYQMDVKNAFLHGELKEVFIEIP